MRSRIFGGIALLLLAGVTFGGANVYPIFKSGLEAFRRGDMAKAKKRFETVVKADPKFGDAFYYLGEIHGRRSDLRRAVAAYKSIEKKWGTWVMAQERLGDIALRLGDRKAAEAYYKEVAPLHPTLRNWMKVASVQLDLKKYEDCEKSIAEADKLTRKDLDLVEMKARLYTETKRFKEALVEYDVLVKATPKDATAHHLRSLTLLSLEREVMAVESFEQVLKLDPYHKGALKQLIKIYEDDRVMRERRKELMVALERVERNPPKVARRVSGSKPRKYVAW